MRVAALSLLLWGSCMSTMVEQGATLPTNHLGEYAPGEPGGFTSGWRTQNMTVESTDRVVFLIGFGFGWGTMWFGQGSGSELTFPIPLEAGEEYALACRFRWVQGQPPWDALPVESPNVTYVRFRMEHYVNGVTTYDDYVQPIRIVEDFETWLEVELPFTAVGYQSGVGGSYDRIEIKRLDGLAGYLGVEFDEISVRADLEMEPAFGSTTVEQPGISPTAEEQGALDPVMLEQGGAAPTGSESGATASIFAESASALSSASEVAAVAPVAAETPASGHSTSEESAVASPATEGGATTSTSSEG